ncbi:hypothetical protein C8F01DRAFT_1133853 [Mycena amicta]|nr:hypothetical protein C8F01DRAFT_1133853 [Mycena amicta]
MESLHLQRAKKWGTSPFLAEWLANIFNYCWCSLEGKKAFQAWLAQEYGPEKAREKLVECSKPPPKRSQAVAGKDRPFHFAAIEFGISEQAMHECHNFAAISDLCAPPRVKPAPKRRRGEPAAEWTTRYHEAILNGSKIPDIDWAIVHAITFSELDKTIEAGHIWYTDLDAFMAVVTAYAPSMLLDPVVLQNGKEELHLHQMELAFRSCLFTQALSQMAWASLGELFFIFKHCNLTSTSAIEKAYREDSSLLWSLVAGLCYVSLLSGHRWQRFSESLSWSEYFRPYFKRYRTTTGETRITVDRKYLQERGGYPSELDKIVVEFMESDFSREGLFFDSLTKYLKANPSEANKFSKDVYDELSELETVFQCKLQLFHTDFGGRLREYAASKDKQCLQDPNFLKYISFLDPEKMKWTSRSATEWSYALNVVRSVAYTWRQTAINKASNSMARFFILLDTLEKDAVSPKLEALKKQIGKLTTEYAEAGTVLNEEELARVVLFEDAWLLVDTVMWMVCTRLGRANDQRLVAARLGLRDPEDPHRMGALKVMLAPHVKRVQAVVASKAFRNPPPLWTQPGPHSTTNSDGAETTQDAHEIARMEVEVRDLQLKDTEEVDASAEEKITDGEDKNTFDDHYCLPPDGGEDLPDQLPTEFKIGKKSLKIFHRILTQPEVDTTLQNDEASKASQIRWADFEKAMKRIGFGVAPSVVGTSVRFDPPAKMARSVAFHRPHPDSSLEGVDLRRIGARLRKCYDWKANMFQRGVAED